MSYMDGLREDLYLLFIACTAGVFKGCGDVSGQRSQLGEGRSVRRGLVSGERLLLSSGTLIGIGFYSEIARV